MYDRHLDTFIQVADSGSFLKASERMFISANAITKQINLLEERLEVKLFQRSPQGLTLTDAGQLIYSEAKKLIRQSNAVLRRARELDAPKEFVIHIGASLMNPVNFLLEQWGKAAQQYPNIRLEIVPFEDTIPGFTEVLDHLGERIDVISCAYDTNFWGDRFQAFHLHDLPLCVACAKSHPLAAHDRLTLPDLYGQTLWIAARGVDEQPPRPHDIRENGAQIFLDGQPLIGGGFVDVHKFSSLQCYCFSCIIGGGNSVGQTLFHLAVRGVGSATGGLFVGYMGNQ